MNAYKKQIYDILVSFLGESKGGYYENAEQFQFGCPLCVANHGEEEKDKYNLEVSIDKGLFQCWKCSSAGDNMSGTLSKLIRRYGGKANEMKFQELMVTMKNDRFLRLPEYVTLLQFNTPKEYIKLPEDFVPIETGDYRTFHGFNYLMGRGLDINLIKSFHIGFIDATTSDWKLKNRIIIPSYDEEGNLNYWTGRSILPKQYQDDHHIARYRNPKVAREDIIFNESRINWNADVTLVEGPFDSLVYPNMIPMLGKKINSNFKLYQALFEKANANVNIFLDGDAYFDVKVLYNDLDRGRLRGKIRYIPVEKTLDPSEIYQREGKIGILRHMAQARRIHEFDLANLYR